MGIKKRDLQEQIEGLRRDNQKLREEVFGCNKVTRDFFGGFVSSVVSGGLKGATRERFEALEKKLGIRFIEEEQLPPREPRKNFYEQVFAGDTMPACEETISGITSAPCDGCGSTKKIKIKK